MTPSRLPRFGLPRLRLARLRLTRLGLARLGLTRFGFAPFFFDRAGDEPLKKSIALFYFSDRRLCRFRR
jgi:hypothetical protein